MAEEEVEIVIRLKDLQSFLSGTEEAALSIRKIGEQAKITATTTDSSMRKVHGVVGTIASAARHAVTALGQMARHAVSSEGVVGRSMSRIREVGKKPLLGGHIGNLAAMATAGLSIEGVKSAIDQTTGLAKAAGTLHQVTGMNAQTAAEWTSVVEANDVNARTFGMALKTVGVLATGVEQKNKPAIKVFKQLGIGMQDVKKHGHNMNDMMGEVIDHFDKVPAGVNKTALATKLFGRGWQQLMPLLGQGSKALAAQRKEAGEYGVKLGGDATKNAMKLHEAQVNLKLATMGLQVQFAEHLAPILFKVFGYVMQLYAVVSKQMTPAFKEAGKIVHTVSEYLKDHHKILMLARDALVLFVAAWVLGRAAIVAARIATVAMNGAQIIGKVLMVAYRVAVIAFRAVMMLAQAAIWLFNAALDANPIALVILAIIALVAIIVVLVTHWKQVKKAVVDFFHTMLNIAKSVINAVIGFVKSHWPILLILFTGPFGLIITAVIKFHDQIIHWISGAITFITKLPGKILTAFEGIGSALLNAIKWPFVQAFNFIKSHMPHIHIKHLGPVPIPSISFGGQHGGVVPYPSNVLVGEAGPEVLSLPKNAAVTPLPTGGMNGVAQSDRVMPPFVISVQIQRQEIARAVGKYTTDRLARR